jgi:hypothetical protein
MIDLNNAALDQKPLLNIEEIFKHITDYQIYSYYLTEELELTRPMCSPLRTDNVPSFTFFRHSYKNLIYWKDHSTGDYGDCFNFVASMFGLSFRQALIKIAKDFSLDLSYKEEDAQGITVLRRSVPKHKTVVMPKRYELGVKIQPFTNTDKEYWSRYGISSQDLKRYNVFSVSVIFSGGRVIGRYKKDNPIYAYLFYKDGTYTWKIYKPKETDKRFKWMSNTNRSILQGWDQMPETGEILLINKALKDVMVANKLGYIGVAMQSESQMIKPVVMEELKRRFKHIFILQDFDLAGVKNANKHYKEYGITPIFLQGFKTRSNGFKDVSDCVKLAGQAKAKEMLNSIIKRYL